MGSGHWVSGIVREMSKVDACHFVVERGVKG